MTEAERLSRTLKGVFEKDAWHGPAIMELLRPITAEQAAARPLAGAHTIWEIALHMTAWQEVVRRALAGEPAPLELPADEDWPAVEEKSAEAWAATLQMLQFSNEALRDAVAALTPEQMDTKIPGREFSVRFMVNGVLHHDLYHSGQIALLKRSLGP